MARTVQVIAADIDRLRAAIGSGTLTVEYETRRVTYRSLAEMERALALLQEELDAASGKKKIRQVIFQTGKGL